MVDRSARRSLDRPHAGVITSDCRTTKRYA
jgi:hypothetical protein